jgi:hypothetical protein
VFILSLNAEIVARKKNRRAILAREFISIYGKIGWHIKKKAPRKANSGSMYLRIKINTIKGDREKSMEYIDLNNSSAGMFKRV